MKQILTSLVTAVSLCIFSCNQHPAIILTGQPVTANKQQTDNDFALAAANASFTDIQFGHLAQVHGNQQEIRDLGKMMVEDQQQNAAGIKEMADKCNIPVPSKLSGGFKKIYEELLARKGTDFDAAYLDIMEQTQQLTIDKFEQEINNGGNEAIKQWAAQALPIFRYHLEMTTQAKDATKNKIAGL